MCVEMTRGSNHDAKSQPQKLGPDSSEITTAHYGLRLRAHCWLPCATDRSWSIFVWYIRSGEAAECELDHTTEQTIAALKEQITRESAAHQKELNAASAELTAARAELAHYRQLKQAEQLRVLN
jgi:hypothetical protein